MKLTNKDKNYLISIGYTNDDFAVIENSSISYEIIFFVKKLAERLRE